MAVAGLARVVAAKRVRAAMAHGNHGRQCSRRPHAHGEVPTILHAWGRRGRPCEFSHMEDEIELTPHANENTCVEHAD
jgi:hypothetical protein